MTIVTHGRVKHEARRFPMEEAVPRGWPPRNVGSGE